MKVCDNSQVLRVLVVVHEPIENPWVAWVPMSDFDRHNIATSEEDNSIRKGFSACSKGGTATGQPKASPEIRVVF